MRVSVIVAHWNQGHTLPLTLTSLANQSMLPSEVIIADDGSSDGSLDWLDGVPDDVYPFALKYTSGPHRGYGLTVSENRAAKVATGELLLFTNADLVHSPSSVLAHARTIGRRVGGGIIREVNRELASSLSADSLKVWQEFEKLAHDKLTGMSNEEYFKYLPEYNVYGIWGGNFSVLTKDFQRVGGFNEEYGGCYGGEEADLIQRLRKTGVRLAWVNDSVTYHLAHESKAYRKLASGNKKYRAEYGI